MTRCIIVNAIVGYNVFITLYNKTRPCSRLFMLHMPMISLTPPESNYICRDTFVRQSDPCGSMLGSITCQPHTCICGTSRTDKCVRAHPAFLAERSHMEGSNENAN